MNPKEFRTDTEITFRRKIQSHDPLRELTVGELSLLDAAEVVFDKHLKELAQVLPHGSEEASLRKMAAEVGGPLGRVLQIMFTLIDEARTKIDELEDQLRETIVWKDEVEDEWSEAIREAHPFRSKSHVEYSTAMKMVGNRRSKSDLVALVNWLLVRLKEKK